MLLLRSVFRASAHEQETRTERQEATVGSRSSIPSQPPTNLGEAEVGDLDICVVVGRGEQQVFGLEITVHHACVAAAAAVVVVVMVVVMVVGMTWVNAWIRES